MVRTLSELLRLWLVTLVVGWGERALGFGWQWAGERGVSEKWGRASLIATAQAELFSLSDAIHFRPYPR